MTGLNRLHRKGNSVAKLGDMASCLGHQFLKGIKTPPRILQNGKISACQRASQEGYWVWENRYTPVWSRCSDTPNGVLE